MRFEIEMNDAVIHQAAALVTRHYNNGNFLNLVAQEINFNNTNDSGEVVARKLDALELNPLTVKIKPYKAWYFSKVIGYASGNTIYVNTRKLGLPLKDRTANFLHESLHLLGYSHKGNSVNAFNLGTVPYRVSSIFVKYLESIGKL